MLWVLIDVTERNRVKASLEQAYAELNRKHQQLVHQERQRALTTMVSGIAHNFNNALAPIQASADLLINVPKTRRDDAKLCYYLKHIQSCTQRAAEIIRRLRRFYRPGEQNTFSDFNLNQIISEAVASTEPRWKEEAEAGGRDINVRTEFGDLPLARGNESEIHEVVTNLIFNAVDAMPEGGEIRIKTEARDQNVLLEFCDTGIGMAEETRQNCLDPFYTTKGPQESGLGLATLESIVQRHDGEISIESEPNKGTTFRITLPTAQREETTHSEESAAIPQAANILVVENEESQRTTLQDVLSIDGHKTDVASDGVEALERYDPSSYDLIITDRAMPQMSGDQFAARVKETAPETPIVMLTGFADMMDASGENPPNLDAFISKPVTQEKLRETIEQML